MPRLSIIVPVYNAAMYLRQCVESILSQSYKDFELILVDDGSGDPSPRICDEYGKQYENVRVVHVPNGGASKARNIGLKASLGEFIWFVDADDWIEKDFLNSINWATMPDILFFGFRKYNRGKNEVNRIRADFKDYYDKEQIGYELNKLFRSKELYFGFTWNKIFRRRIIDEYNLCFREELIIKEDEVFTLEFCRRVSSLGISPAVPYNYRIVDTSLSHSVKGNKNMLQLATFLEAELDASEYPEELRKSFKLAILNYYFSALIENRDSGKLKDDQIGAYVTYVCRNKEIIKQSKKARILSLIPTNFLKKRFVRFYLKLIK